MFKHLRYWVRHDWNKHVSPRRRRRTLVPSNTAHFCETRFIYGRWVYGPFQKSRTGSSPCFYHEKCVKKMTSSLHHYNSGSFTCRTSSGLLCFLKTVGNCPINQKRERARVAGGGGARELLHLELRMNPSLRFYFHHYGQEKGLQTWNLQMFKVGSSYWRAQLSCNVSHFVTELQNPSCSWRASAAMSAQAAVWPVRWRLIATTPGKKVGSTLREGL